MSNTVLRYPPVVRALHWLLALLLVAVFALGLWLGSLGLFDARQATAGLWHKSLGLLAALLMLARGLHWRWHRPALPPLGKPWEQRLATLVRGLLYAGVLLAALSGYLLATGSGRPLDWFGVLGLPPLVRLDSAMLAQVKSLHGFVVWTLAVLVGLHLLGAVKHQWLDRQPILKRML